MAIDGDRPATIVLEAPSDKLDRDLRDAARVLQRFSDHTSRILDRARQIEERRDKEAADKKKRSGALRAVGRGVGRGVARFGTGFIERAGAGLANLAADGFDEVVNFEKGLARFAIAAGSSTAETSVLRSQIVRLSRETGVARTELLAGAQSYIALTGDAAGATKAMDLFAKVSLASGASMADIATTAASLRDNLKIDPKDFEAGFSALIVQGKAGAIELKDLAGELAGVAPQFAAFKGGAGTKGLATLGAALQAGRKGFGTASETATGLRALMVAIQRNADKLGQSKIFTRGPGGKKELRSFREIIDGIANSKLARDPTLLTKAFGSDEAKRMFDQLVQNRALFDELEAKSAEGGAVAADSLKYMESPAAKLEKAMNALKLSVAEAFTPARIELFARTVERIASGLSKVVGLIDDIANFGEIRDKAKKNEEELVRRGAYTGDDRYLRAVSSKNEARIEAEFQQKLRAAQEARAKRVAAAALASGEDIFAIKTQSTLASSRPAGLPTSAPASRSFSQSTATPPVVVEIDGNAVFSATKKASAARRNVGGR